MLKNFVDFEYKSPDCRVCLFYGSNEDMMLYAQQAISLHNSNVFSYFEDEFAISCDDICEKEIFIDKKIILIKDITENFLALYKKLAPHTLNNITFILFSTKLRVKSQLVNEISKNFTAIKCYDLFPSDLLKLIKKECKNANILLSDNYLNILKNKINVSNIHQMLKKINLIDNLSLSDLDIILRLNESKYMNYLYDISNGSTKMLYKISDISMLRVLQSHFLMLYHGSLMNEAQISSESIVRELNIFFKNEDIFLRQIKDSSSNFWKIAIEELIQAEIDLKKSSKIFEYRLYKMVRNLQR
ncbi:hypothetical protein [Candidatus Gromoviella agglomerans]|uniref:hypothetical protein n=1 Tax=Candidatus Gromoviella agglomerans TaxID=2806609 RepID=UPI001E487791|nr:hypothetical protein [Candidatus Gromoviella agglomerans]UFX98201.1 DNA polymerase III subunit delta [Candidatus Gromoviella agglomerans]